MRNWPLHQLRYADDHWKPDELELNSRLCFRSKLVMCSMAQLFHVRLALIFGHMHVSAAMACILSVFLA